jgi:delta-aminolevulinic acid dehydratase/porphobilinogen synthase
MEIIIKEISLPTVILTTIQSILTSIQRKKRGTATSRQRNQLEIITAADKATKNYIPELKIVYKYRLKNYNNHDKCYYILSITSYLPLNNRHLIT